MLTALRKYCDFKGRAPRAEYWWFFLLAAILMIVAQGLDAALFGKQSLFTLVLFLAIFLPYLGVGVRRFHDIGMSGWWVLLGVIPILGLLALIFFYVRPGTPGENRFGPNPLGDGTPQGAAA